MAACVYMVSVVVGSDLVGGYSWWDGVVVGGRWGWGSDVRYLETVKFQSEM